MPELEPPDQERTRRTFLLEGASVAAATTLPSRLFAHRRLVRQSVPRLETPRASQAEALRVLGRSALRSPDSLPNPTLGVGVDTLPQIEHVVVLMLENHSYDNILGMLGRARGQRPRGDGFTLASDGLATATNPYPNGQLQRAFRMPTTCQLPGTPSQERAASHTAYDGGRNDGFVRTTIDPYASQIAGAGGDGVLDCRRPPPHVRAREHVSDRRPLVL